MAIVLAYGCIFSAAVIAAVAGYRQMAASMSTYFHRRSLEASEQLGDMFMDVTPKTAFLLYACSPVAFAVFAWMYSGRAVALLVGLAIGFVAPRFILKHIRLARRKKFQSQLVDALLVMSSSLKAGLSMMQTFGVVAEELPPPISQEFGLLIKQTRMGIVLDEAIGNLKRRMPFDDVTLFSTAVLVSRETGGDVTHLFSRLVETLRERKKLKEKIKTLTFMARLQGIVMGLLPIGFAYAVYNMNHEYFKFFFTDPLGRSLLIIVVVLQIVGGLLFFRFSRAPVM